MNLRPPQSQKADARPIAFVLDDQTNRAAPRISVDLTIRPEDLTRVDNSRLTTQQTLGGAWVDDFGPGIPSLTISGHTGWRRRFGVDDERDGQERFRYLFENVFTRWHKLRNDAKKAGDNPDKVRLVFADSLDQFAAVVAPVSFTLKRSKSRPLLCQYQISMTVVSQDIDELSYLKFGKNSIADPMALEALGLDSLTASVDRLTSYLKDIQNFVDRTLVARVRKFLIQTIRLYQSVRTAIRTADEIAGSLIAVARMTAQAGMNIFRTIGAVASLPGQIKSRLMNLASEYSNIFCVLKNAVQQQKYLPDYNPLFGSSNCSSTSGGRPLSPLSGVNPFYLYASVNRTLPVTVTPSGQAGLMTMANTDVALAPMSMTALSGSLSQITNGMSVA